MSINSKGEIHVDEFGAVGDGEADDAPYINAAFMVAAAQKTKRIRFGPKVYRINSPLDFSVGRHWDVRGGLGGDNNNPTVIRAGAIMDSVLNLSDTNGTFNDLMLDGNNMAAYCMHLDNCPNSFFNNIHCKRAISDGVHLASGGNNDRNSWHNLQCNENGSLYISQGLIDSHWDLYGIFVAFGRTVVKAGTASTTSGGHTVMFSGIDLSSLGLRAGDPIRVGSQFGMITSITDATHLEVDFTTLTSTITDSGQLWAIGRGDGYHEARSGDNNIASFSGAGMYQGNAAYAISIDGIYGNKYHGSFQCTYSPFWFVRIGSSGSDPVYDSILSGFYFENAGRKPWLIRSAQGGLINYPMDFGGDVDTNVDYCGNNNVVGGLYLGFSGISAFGNPDQAESLVPAKRVGGQWLEGALHTGPMLFTTGLSGLAGTVADRSVGSSGGSFICKIGGGAPITVTDIANGHDHKGDGADELLLLQAVGGSTVTVVHGSGIWLRSPTWVMQSGDKLLLHYDGTNWCELMRVSGPYGV